MQKPPKTFWQIWNMSFGFLGIQFGWGLQMANMSAIYEYLGATRRPDSDALAGGAADRADRAADHRPRQRPHLEPARAAASLLSGGRDSEFARADPDAATRRRCGWRPGCLWILDCLASTSAWSRSARSWPTCCRRSSAREGFAMQSLFIGLGAVVASALPWMLTNCFHVTERRAPATRSRSTVRLSFYMGAAAFFGAVLWTIVDDEGISAGESGGVSQREGENTAAWQRTLRRSSSHSARCRRPCGSWPRCRFCTWLGLFCMWLYFPVAVARNVFGAPTRPRRCTQTGVEWAGMCFGDVLGGVLRLLVLPAGLAEPIGRKHDPQPVPAVRRAGTALGGGHPRQETCCCSR